MTQSYYAQAQLNNLEASWQKNLETQGLEKLFFPSELRAQVRLPFSGWKRLWNSSANQSTAPDYPIQEGLILEVYNSPN